LLNVAERVSKLEVSAVELLEDLRTELIAALESGQAISYRFLRDAKGWRILASTERVDARKAFSPIAGVVGVDVNADHLAVAETDRFGNLVTQFSVPCVTYGKSADQSSTLSQSQW
jgi:hypothetical protein